MKIDIKLEGAKELERTLQSLVRTYPEETAAALYQEGMALDALAVQKVPVDTGRLRATHYTSPPTIAGHTVMVEVGFGTDYAVYVHERLDLRHPTGEAKFLERAMNERANGFAERLAKRIQQNVERGIRTPPLTA